MRYVTGTQKVINNLMMQRFKMLHDIGEVVEKTCVDVANSAKAGHAGNQAHMNERYQNQTSDLTRSISQELTKVDWASVEGLVFATKEYAIHVELGTVKNKAYPFLYPALVSNKKNFENRLKQALKR